MAFCDFVVRYDPEKDSAEDLTKKILYSVVIKRIKAKKPLVMFVGGDSGEGKSMSCVRLQELLMEIQGLAIKDYFEAMNVFVPMEYPEKIDLLLFDKKYKKANVLCIHEAREAIKAKNWSSFLTQSVADINAMSRSVKRLVVMIVSQFIRDITADIRYTLNLYCIVRRPKGKKARLYINVMWKDDRDLEKPKLRKRKLAGYLVDSKGRYRRFIPTYLEMNMPDVELVELFDRLDTEAKGRIIRGKLDKMISEMRLEAGDGNRKVDAMLDHYTKNPSDLGNIGKRYRGSWRITPSVREMHGLNTLEAREFERKVNDYFKEKGIINN